MVVDGFDRIDFNKSYIIKQAVVLTFGYTLNHLGDLKTMMPWPHPRPIKLNSLQGWGLGVGISQRSPDDYNIQPGLKTTSL